MKPWIVALLIGMPLFASASPRCDSSLAGLVNAFKEHTGLDHINDSTLWPVAEFGPDSHFADYGYVFVHPEIRDAYAKRGCALDVKELMDKSGCPTLRCYHKYGAIRFLKASK